MTEKEILKRAVPPVKQMLQQLKDINYQSQHYKVCKRVFDNDIVKPLIKSERKKITLKMFAPLFYVL